MATVVDVINVDTWIGIYFNDRLVYEDHSISTRELLKLVDNRHIELHGYWECSIEWFENVGHFPEQLQDVMFAYNGKATPFYNYLEAMEQ